MNGLGKICLRGSLLLMICFASGCSMMDGTAEDSYRNVANYDGRYYDYNSYYDERANIDYRQVNQQDYVNSSNSYYYNTPNITVPNSYHTSGGSQVRSHKSRDKNWAQTQNGNDYTIQLDNNAKASSVAKTLTKAPRQYRKAQIRYQKNGQSRYTGVYGSYKSKKEAQQAYEKLPSDLKSQANIKKWNSIQQDL